MGNMGVGNISSCQSKLSYLAVDKNLNEYSMNHEMGKGRHKIHQVAFRICDIRVYINVINVYL